MEQKHTALVIGNSSVKRLRECVFSSQRWHMNLDQQKYSLLLYSVAGLNLNVLVKEV